MFSYNRALPFDIKDTISEYKDQIAVHDISFENPAGGRIMAFLVKPPGEGPFSGIVFLHPGPGSRSTFLDEAVTLARMGSVSLLIDAPWSESNMNSFIKSVSGKPEDLREMFRQFAVGLIRGVDLLASVPEVDINRAGFVGHSFGALFGGILAGVDKRIRACVLMAGVGRFADVAVLNDPGLKGQKLEEFKRVMEPIDPFNFIGKANSDFLFQLGLKDRFFQKQTFLDYFEAAGGQKQVKWYDADHYLNEEAWMDRVGWLKGKLGLAQDKG